MEFGFWSVVPPVVTIALALIIKNVFVALFVGITLASLILSGWNVFTGVNGAFYSIVHTFESSGNTIVIMSMFLIGALIYLIEHSGGIDGVWIGGRLAAKDCRIVNGSLGRSVRK